MKDCMRISDLWVTGSWPKLASIILALFIVSTSNAQVDDAVTSDESELSEITVTGSRIRRTTFDTPTPITVIDAQTVSQSGFNNIGDILMRAPAVGIGLGSTNSWYENDAGASFVNLRGLGTDRTLVLIDGRRRVSGTQASSAVDLSTIPASMVESIEIVTGGASAVYGADAVTGVVNVILKDDFEGLELSARTGMNKDGYGKSYTLGMHAGTLFSDGRGNINFGVTYNNEDPLMLSERSDLHPLLRTDSNPANTGPNDGIPDSITYSDWRVPLLAYSGAMFIGPGLYTIDPDLRLMENDEYFGGAFGYGGRDCYCPVDFNMLRTELEVFSTLTSMNYELTDDLELFVEGDFSNTKAVDYRVPTTTFFTPIQRENPFVPADLGALMDTNGLTSVGVSRANLDQGPQFAEIERYSYTAIAGLRGSIADRWNWEVFYQTGKYDQKLRTHNSHITSRFNEATDVISDPVTGDPICRSDAARANGCQPLNILGPNVATQDALDYVLHTRILDVKADQDIIGASITGNLFELPGGPMGVAAGFEYREEGLSSIDDGLAEANLLFIDDNGGPPVNAEFDVTEFYVEAVAPLVSGRSMMHELSIEGAMRYSDYSTIGNTTSWKFGGSWAPVEDIRFRATISESVRAPGLAELFSPGFNSPTAVADPCDASRINLSPNRAANCQALGLPFAGWVDQLAIGRQIFVGGNPDLQEEVADTLTFGLVFEPSFAEGLRVAVDFWQIEITDAINSIPFQDILDRCVDLDSTNNPFCPLITRAPSFEVMRVNTSDVNIGRLNAEGIDFQVLYDVDAFFSLPGNMRFLVNGTYVSRLEELVDATDAGTLIIKDGEISNPTLRLNVGLSYFNGPLDVDLNLRYVDAADFDVQGSNEATDVLGVSSEVFTDVRTSYELGENYSVFLGINNVLDNNPPRASGTTQGLNNASLYDNIGRYYFVGATASF